MSLLVQICYVQNQKKTNKMINGRERFSLLVDMLTFMVQPKQP